MSEIKSIDTEYDGHKFRSRQEARWAVFFNQLDIEYRYELEGFELPNGELYLPDFYLPNIGFRSTETGGIWVEVKGVLNNGRDSNVFETLETFVAAKNEPAALFVGRIGNQGHRGHGDGTIYEFAPRGDGGCYYDLPMVWVKCEECGKIKLEFPESNYMTCESCGGKMAGNEYAYHVNLDVKFAMEKANKARFEHGESP